MIFSKDMKFKTKLNISVGLMMGISLFLFGLFSYMNTKSHSIDKIESEYKKVSKTLVDIVDIWLEDKKMVIDAIALKSVNYDFEDSEAIKKEMIHYTKAIGARDSYIGLENGVMILGSGSKLPDGYDPRIRPWYKAAKQSGQSGISNVYIDATTKSPIITIYAPIKENGSLVGVVGTDISLDSVVKQVSKVSEDGVYAFLVDSSGTVIAHKDENLIGKKLVELGEVYQFIDTKASANEGIVDLNEIGKNHFVSYRKTELTKWRAFINVDKTISYAFLKKQELMLAIIGSILIAVTILFLVWLIHMLMKPLRTLNKLALNLASSEGDLTKRLEVINNDEFGEVSTNINTFIDKLHVIIKNSKSSSAENASISEELSMTATEVGKSAEVQSSIVVETTQKGENLRKYLQNSIADAKKSQESLLGTTEELKKMSQKVAELENILNEASQREQHLSSKMDQTSKDAEDIKTVLTIIKDIADQTNLLALNAAIEAARAGEHGRGFAVVADEVRKLAERTQKSLTEIDASVNVIVQSIIESNQEMDSNAKMIEEIVDTSCAIRKGMDETSNILENSVSQSSKTITDYIDTSKSIDEILKEINTINETTEKNARSVEEVAAAADHLHAMTEQLNNELIKFKS